MRAEGSPTEAGGGPCGPGADCLFDVFVVHGPGDIDIAICLEGNTFQEWQDLEMKFVPRREMTDGLNSLFAGRLGNASSHHIRLIPP
jgi:hypothetical protein